MYQENTPVTNLSSDELRELLNDDKQLEERVTRALSLLESEKSDILIENRKTAEESLDKEPLMIELRGKVNELTEEGRQLFQSIQEKLSEIKSKSNNISQDTALALLQTAAAEKEEESEKLVKDFMNKELELESFLEQYLEMRKEMHLRKIKADKMSELLRNPTAFKESIRVPYPIQREEFSSQNYQEFIYL